MRSALGPEPGVGPGKAYVAVTPTPTPGPPAPTTPETACKGGDAKAAPRCQSMADVGTTLPNTGARCCCC
jgi:hypothetical protein